PARINGSSSSVCHKNGIKMSGVAVFHRAFLAIQNAEQEGDEFACRDVVTEQTIDFAAQGSGTLGFAGVGAHSRLYVGHQKRSRYSLASHIGDADSKPILIEPEDVVVITAHDSRRPPGSGNLESGKLRNLPGKQ